MAASICVLAQIAAPILAVADGDPPKPALGIAGSDALEIVVSESDSEWRSWTGDLNGALRFTLYNSGGVSVTPHFDLVPSGARVDCPDNGFTLQAPLPTNPVPANGSYSYDLLVKSVDRGCVGVTATLLITGTPNIDAVAAAVATNRHIGWWEFGPPLVAALIAGLLVILFTGSFWRKKWKKRTPIGDSWSFSGSWLTSISALAAALAGILAASGFVTELLPGVPLGNFFGLSLTFTGLIVAAPLMFSIFQVTDWDLKDDPGGSKNEDGTAKQIKAPILRGRLAGLFLGCAMTCAGVAGLLAMLVVLTGLSSADKYSKILVVVLLGLVLVVVAGYVLQSTRNTVNASDDEPTDKPSALQLDSAAMAILPMSSADPYRRFTGTL